MTRTALAAMALAAHSLVTADPEAWRAEGEGPVGYETLAGLMSERGGERREAARRLLAARDPALVAGIVDALFFIPPRDRGEALEVLEGLTGERPGRRHLDWVEVVGRRGDLLPRSGYADWKLRLLERIDPAYRKVFYPGAPSRIRLEEVVWGGVGLDGIPALERPATVAASRAGYLVDEELVFGASLGGERRAYPLRILDWHEMVNDVLGGRAVTLSYCTLCRSGVLFDTAGPVSGAYTFGTSGLLYRSNKLMFDRQSYTLWQNLTGEPVFGRLAASGLRLPMLPLTLTTWRDWRERHPGTSVLALDRESERRWSYRYVPGAADRRRAGVRFPVWSKSDALDERAEVFALHVDGAVRAYPVARVIAEGTINDEVSGQGVLLLGDRASGAVRAYRRGARSFRPGARAGELLDEMERSWLWSEEALVPPAGSGLEPLPRLAGHVAYWFGWYGIYPEAELYPGEGKR